MTRISGSGPVVGVEIGSKWMRGAVVAPRGSGFLVLSAVEIPRLTDARFPTGDEVTRLVQGFERQGVWVRDVVLGAPPDGLLSAVLELPPRSSGAPIDQLARTEIERDGNGPMEVAVWDLPDGPRTRAHEYLVVGLDYETSTGLIDPFQRLGIGVMAIEPAASAIARATGTGRRLVIDFGMNSARMYAYDGQKVLFMRTIQFDSKHVDLDRIFRGIDNNIEYLVGRFPPLEDASILLVGENRSISSLAKMIESEYETSVSCGIDLVDDGASWIARAEFGSRWVTAIGLASWRIAEEVAA